MSVAVPSSAVSLPLAYKAWSAIANTRSSKLMHVMNTHKMQLFYFLEAIQTKCYLSILFYTNCKVSCSSFSLPRSPWSCNLSVLDYPSAFHQLSKGDIDQLVTTRPLEACTITVDLSMDRITEQHIGGSLRRFQRDLCEYINITL